MDLPFVCDCCHELVNSKSCREQGCQGGYQFLCGCGEIIDVNSIRSHKCSDKNIKGKGRKEFQFSNDKADAKGGDYLYIGSNNGLTQVNCRKKNDWLGGNNTTERDKMLHHCLDVLYLYIATEKSSVKVFVAILMKYGPIKKEIEARDHDSFKRGVREGLDKMVNHFANVAPVFLAGTKVTADSYDKLVNLRITKKNNDLQIECGEKIVMVNDLATSFGKTFISEIISCTIDANEVIYRYFDIRVVVLKYIPQLFLKKLIDASSFVLITKLNKQQLATSNNISRSIKSSTVGKKRTKSAKIGVEESFRLCFSILL